MATFLNLQNEVADRLNLSISVAAELTRIKRWINLAINDIAGRRAWKFLQEREIVQTVVDITTGTVDITNGSATVTGSGTAFAAADVRKFIQFEGANDWYEITARASTTSITITPAYGGTTATGSDYIIRQFFYPLSTAVARISDIRQWATPRKLTSLGFYTLDLYRPLSNYTGPPQAYAQYRLDPAVAATAAKKIQVQFEPCPDAVYNMEVRFLKNLADLSADGDISDIPLNYHLTIADGAEWLGLKYLNNPAEEKKKEMYEGGIYKMILEESQLDDWHPVVQSSDDVPYSGFLQFPPGTFNNSY